MAFATGPSPPAQARSLRPVLPLFLLLTACGPSPAAFDTQFAARYCALLFSCEDSTTLGAYGWADERDCVAELSRADTAGPDDYDQTSARACLDALDTVTCDDLAKNAFPAACAQVE